MKALRAILTGVVFGSVAVFAARLDACSVPVFRYALEQWPALPYEVTVFHRGPLGEDGRRVADWLSTCADDAQTPVNLRVRTVDLDGTPDEKTRELWKAQTGAATPRMVLTYPESYGTTETAWTGRLTAAEARAVIDSPARREIARRLLSGQSAVWVLLECGDRKKDDAAAGTLDAELPKLKETLKLPEILGEDVQGGAGPADLRIDFSVLRLSRKDPAETVFVEMLVRSDPTLAGASEPAAFPVFGRGRALCAVVGDEINADTIHDIGEYLTGPCSCIVKEQNPGMDLLMCVDWEGGVAGGRWVKSPDLPPLTGPEALVERAQGVGAKATPTRWSWSVSGCFRLTPVGLGVAGAILLVLAAAVVATVIVRRRKSKSED